MMVGTIRGTKYFMFTCALALAGGVAGSGALVGGCSGDGDAGPSGGTGGTGGTAGAGGAAAAGGTGGESGTEFRVGPEGGSGRYTTPDSVVVDMTVPEGSLTEEVVITVRVADELDGDPDTMPGLVFDFGPDGTQFDPPLALVITYDPNALDGASESDLALYERVGDGWESIPSTVDTDANTLSAEIDGFSIFAVLRGVPLPSGWQHPASRDDFVSPGGSYAERPAVAINDSGNAVVAWRQHDDKNQCTSNSPCYQVFISEYLGRFWNHPDNLADNISPDGFSVSEPSLAMDNDGDVVLAYVQQTGTLNTCTNMSCSQVFMSERRGGIWDHPGSLADFIGPMGIGSRYADVAMDNDGNAIIAWAESASGPPTQILMSEYRGGAWNHPTRYDDNIGPADGGESRTPSVAMDDNGNALIAWVQEDNTTTDCVIGFGCEQVFLSEYRNGSWTHPADGGDHISADSGQGREFEPLGIGLDMGNGGEALIGYQHIVGPDTNRPLFLSEYRNGSWDHPASGSDNVISPAGAAYAPAVAINDAGDAVVVWKQEDGSTNCGGGPCLQVYLSEYRNGTWTHPSSLADGIAPATHTPQLFIDAFELPSVAIDNNGDAIIVWAQKDGTEVEQACLGGGCRRVYMSEYRNGTWTHPTGFDDSISFAGTNASGPVVAMSENGSAILAWSGGSTTSNGSIFVSQYFP